MTKISTVTSLLFGFCWVLMGVSPLSAQVQVKSATETQATCAGSATGKLTVVAGGGTAPYQYSKDGGTTFQSSNVFSNLIAGTYPIVIKDGQAAESAPFPATVTQPPRLQVSRSIKNVTCFQGKDGEVVITATGGTPPYAYSLNNGGTYQTSNTFSNLSASNSYYIRVRDAKGCTVGPMGASVGGVPKTNITVSGTDPICFDGTDGTMTVIATGGNHSFQYSIDGGQTFQQTYTFPGLTAGTYNIVVRNLIAACPDVTTTYTLNQPDPVRVEVISPADGPYDILCPDQPNGTLIAEPSKGVEPYTYAWSNGRNDQENRRLTAGSYTVTVTDANGCEATSSRALTSAPAWSVSLPACQSVYYGYEPQACATLTPSVSTNDVPPYIYHWSNGATTASITVCPTATTNYTVTVTNGNDCSVTATTKVDVIDVRCGTGLGQVSMCFEDSGETICVPKSQVGQKLGFGGWSVGPCGSTPCGNAPVQPKVAQTTLPEAKSTVVASAGAAKTEATKAKEKARTRPDGTGTTAASSTLFTNPTPFMGNSSPTSDNTFGTVASESMTARFDAASGRLMVKVDCETCSANQSLTLNVRDRATTALVYTGPVTLVGGKGQASIPLTGTFTEGLGIEAIGARQILSKTIGAKAMRTRETETGVGTGKEERKR